MTRIAALNDFALGSSDEEDAGPTREALEADASKNYNEAIRHLASRNFDEAYDQFCLVLQNPFIEKACWPEGVEPGGTLPQDLALRYSCLKNLGNLASKRGEYDQSVEYYMDAVRVDRTEVTLWHRLGASAIKLLDFELALVAFQEGYNVNPKHWPCLDQLLSVLYILRMYMDCLGLATHALLRDPGYIKALAFKDKIFEIQPSLKEDVKFFFKDSSVLFKKVDYDKARGEKFLSTCEALRPPNKIPQPLPSIPSQRMRKPLGELTWENLCQSLLSTYDSLMEDDGMAFAGKIDICEALNQVKMKKVEKDMEELGVAPLDGASHFDGKFTLQETLDIREKNNDRDRCSSDSVQGNPIRISGRRRTIELGESQDSFRVSEKRRSVDSDTSRPEDTKSDDGAAATTRAENTKEELKENSKEKESAKDETEMEINGTTEVEAVQNLSEILDGKKEENKDKIEMEDVVEKCEKEHSQKVAEVDVRSSPEEGSKMKATPDVAEISVQNTDISCVSRDGGPIVDMTAFDIGPNNDFQGFTNASVYKERHLKLVQGKNALQVIDEEDLGTEQSIEQDSQGQESHYTGKGDCQGPGVQDISQTNEAAEMEECNAKEQDSIKDVSNNSPEEKEKANRVFLPGQEGEIKNQDTQDPDKLQSENDNQNGSSIDKSEVESAEDNNVGETEQSGCEEQSVIEKDKIDEEFAVQGNQDKIATDNNECEAENIDLRENEVGVTEEMEECDPTDNENVGMEETEGEIEEIEGVGMQEEEGIIEENECMAEENEEILEENEGVIDENEEAVLGENEGYPEGMEDDDMLNAEVTETEAAVNALKGIMALQPTEILGLPEPDFDYENEFVEYFDGGVYEEDEDDLAHQMGQGGEEEEDEEEDEGQEMTEDIQDIDESQENIEQEMDMEQDDDGDNAEELQNDDSSQEVGGENQGDEGLHPQEEENEELQTNNEQQSEGGRAKEDNEQKGDSSIGKETESKDESTDNKEKNQVSDNKEQKKYAMTEGATDKNTGVADKRDTDDTTTGMSDKTEGTHSRTNVEVARKSKRTKRGLERELEQLDYWGRRQERDAKRRRRTISSKLLGGIEEAEYLTWADLLRSFVPAQLINASIEDKRKKAEENSIENKLGVPSVSEAKVPTPPKVDSNNQSSADQNDTILMNGHHSSKYSDNKEVNSSSDSKVAMGDDGKGRVPASTSADSERRTQEDASKEGGKGKVISVENKPEKQIDDKVLDKNQTLKQQREELILSSSLNEEEQVQTFLMQYEDNGGILHLLQQFLKLLMKRYKFIWPLSAGKMFTEVYPRVRNHVLHGSPLNLKESYQRLRDESLLSLTHWELCCSIYQGSKHNTLVDSTLNPFSENSSHLEEDMFRLMLMLGRGDVWLEETPQFHTRLRWLQSQIRLIRGQPEESVSYLELLLADLDRLAEGGSEYICNRVRIESDIVVINNSEVKRQLNVLQRSHMLEQVVDHYTDCRYRVVADLLTTIFHEPTPKSRPGVSLPSRQTQLAILVDSLYRISEYKDVIYWGSFSLTEALMRYNRAEAEEEKNRWAKTLMKIADIMNKMLTNNIAFIAEVDRERLVEMVSTLIRMLVVQLERPQSAQMVPFETLTPWMLLHRILSFEESQQDPGESKKVDQLSLESSEQTVQLKMADIINVENGTEIAGNIGEGVVSSSITSDAQVIALVGQKLNTILEAKGKESLTPALTPYPSTLFLVTAHDELGKHSWCCYDDGIFLLYCLDVLLAELRRPFDDQHRQLLNHTLEQVTFCLYSHPSKKSKHKHLRDHGVPQIAFCWERAMQLYQYYRPNTLPDFQTSQIPSITDDAAVLFKRIIALLPEEAKPADQTSGVEAYINGEVTECRYTPFSPPTDIINDCFYLLGDYYFKNKEWMNAIKYYKLDLSINHERLESWAPLGLAMKAMLESQLNSCEVIEDEEAFFSLAKAAVQCLRQALKLDQYHTNLWVEFGGLVYMVHSHASRLLKQDLNPDISLETFDMLEKFKSEMLNLSENCFTKALSIQQDGYEDEGLPDERWLHCYMLGKVAEKKSKSPSIIIQYYIKASRYLHNIRAKYPPRINYNSPQEFSVEALEMYYRIHAFILKYLHQREGRDVEPEVMDSFIKCLDQLETSPFSNCQEKKNISVAGVDFESEVNLDGQSLQKKRPLENQSNEGPPAKKLLDEVILSGDGVDTNEEEVEVLTGKEQDPLLTSKEGAASEKEKKESDDEIQVVEEKVVEKKDHFVVVSRCLSAMQTCLSRFQEHYKTMYRLAHYYHTSKFHKDNNKAQNYLLGCQLWQNVGYMPVNGLFNERKVWIQQPKNSNFFHGVWRIPNDEIDRPGSFAAHMYRCVSLILDILPQMKDFFMILQMALALKNSPDKDKKYLRDNERELLSEHATQVGLQAMKDKFKVLFKSSSPQPHGNRHLRFLLDVYKCYKQISKHLPGSEPHFAKMLTDAYASYKNIKVENRSNVLRVADSFCHRHQYLQHRTNASNPTIRNPMSSTGSSLNAPAVARRGRPPLTGRGRGRGRGSMYGTNSRTVGDMLAVQQAYKIYESLISTQTLLNKKELPQSQVYGYQKQLEGYQTQLMKYLQIPCVSQYFQASLQDLGTTSTKLPPPKPGASSSDTSAAASGKVNESSSNTSVSAGRPNPGSEVTSVAASQGSSPPVSKSSATQPDPQRTSLSALAARSQAHGISITSVSVTKASGSQSQTLKPNMSVTVSSVKTSPPSLKGRDISVVSVSQTSPVKTSVSLSVSPSKSEASNLALERSKLPLPASTTCKPVNTTAGSTNFKLTSSAEGSKPTVTLAGSNTFKDLTSVSGSTTFKPVTPPAFKDLTTVSGSTTFKPVTPTAESSNLKSNSSSGASTTFKPSASSVSSVPKLPAGTTLTRPRDVSSTKGSGPRPQLQANPRPQLQANPRPIKNSETENVTVKKLISQMSSSNSPISKASDSSNIARSNPGLPSKPTLPKDMTITPAPRIKTQIRQAITSSRPMSSPSTSFFRAFEASLGLSSSNSVPEKSAVSVVSHGSSSAVSRPINQGQPTSISSSAARAAQLSTQELLQLAYGGDGRSQTSVGRGQTSSSISSYSNQYSKSSPQQQRVQPKQPSSTSSHAANSTLVRIQNTLQNSQPLTSGSQQSPQQSRSSQQASKNLSQSKPISKTTPSKPPQNPSASSDDIITLD